jgi:hypothetical protein
MLYILVVSEVLGITLVKTDHTYVPNYDLLSEDRNLFFFYKKKVK